MALLVLCIGLAAFGVQSSSTAVRDPVSHAVIPQRSRRPSLVSGERMLVFTDTGSRDKFAGLTPQGQKEAWGKYSISYKDVYNVRNPYCQPTHCQLQRIGPFWRVGDSVVLSGSGAKQCGCLDTVGHWIVLGYPGLSLQ